MEVEKHATNSSIKTMFTLLLDYGSDFRVPNGGRSILLLALDNLNPIAITKVLLDTFMAKHINENFSLYTRRKRLYSPVEYARRGLHESPANLRDILVSILEGCSCDPVFYATHGGAQPDDFIGAPDHIKSDEMRRRKQLEADQRAREQRQQQIDDEIEDHDRRAELRSSEAVQAQTIAQTQHQLATQHDKDRADQRDQTMQKFAELDMRLDRQKALQRQTEAEHTRNAEIEHDRQQKQAQLTYESKHHRLLITQFEERATREQAVRDAERKARASQLQMETSEMQRRNTEQRRLIEFESAEHTKMNRERKGLLDYETQQYSSRAREQKSLISEQRRLVDAQKDVQRALQASPMREITYDDLD